jgi:hypothetical protein
LEPTLRDIISRGGVAAIARATQCKTVCSFLFLFFIPRNLTASFQINQPVDVTQGFTEYWIDGTNTRDITISVGQLEYDDWLSVNKTLWEPSNINVVTGLPSMNVTIDGWGQFTLFQTLI